ncbi:type VII secretion integral membrane protein EccD, partial [Nocardia cyriacigeorgica]|uniref:type VII secretion integral membrane protein EccD n=1 Tax=Nocardia cyriacigeorgica TaxID=135487 RepID=UPI0024547432
RRPPGPARSGGLSFPVFPIPVRGGRVARPPPPRAAGGGAGGAAPATMIRLTGLGIATLMAVTVTGLTLTAAALPLAYSDLAVRQVSSGAVFVGLILLTLAPRIAVVIARIRPPDLPDPGNEVAPSTLTGIFDAESGGDGEPDRAEESDRREASTGIESRARLAVTSLRGLIVAISTLLAVSAVITAAVSPGGIREIVLAGAVAVVLVLRSRWYPDLVQAIALVCAAAVTVAGVGWVLVGAYETAPARLVVVAVVAALAVAACVAAIRMPGKRLSPPTRRVIDLIEYAHILVVPVIAFWIMGIYTAMRGL